MYNATDVSNSTCYCSSHHRNKFQYETSTQQL